MNNELQALSQTLAIDLEKLTPVHRNAIALLLERGRALSEAALNFSDTERLAGALAGWRSVEMVWFSEVSSLDERKVRGEAVR